MYTWICDECHAHIRVKPEIIGEVRECPKCHVTSEVVVADAQPAQEGLPTIAVQGSPRKTAADLAHVISQDVLVSAGIAHLGLVLVLIGSVIATLVGIVATDPALRGLISIGIAGLASTVVAWPVYSIANESFRSRRMLEEILKRL